MFIITINNKSERNYRGKCLGWPVTSYGGAILKQKENTSRISACGKRVRQDIRIQFKEQKPVNTNPG